MKAILNHIVTKLVAPLGIAVLSAAPSFSQCPTGYVLSGTEAVSNGNFSSGNASFTNDFIYVAENPDVDDELWAEGTYSVCSNSSAVHHNWNPCTGLGGSGNFLMVNGNTATNKSVWRQTVTVVPETVYYFTLWITSVHPKNPARLEFSVNGTRLSSNITASATTGRWREFYATWNSGSNTSADISINNCNARAHGNDFGLDNISFAPCSKNP